MRKMIQKILREEFLFDDIQLVEVPYQQLKNYFILGEAQANAPIFKKEENYINNKIKRNSGDSEYYETGNFKFNIEPTTHWLQRLHRKMEPEYKNNENIFDPDLDDGVYLLFKVIDEKLVDLVRKNDWNSKPNPCFELINLNSPLPNGKKVPYSMIINIFPIGKKTYRIRLVTQIKGERLYSDTHNCTRIKIFENKKRIEKLFPSFFELTVV
jgi:hypothetical protein